MGQYMRGIKIVSFDVEGTLVTPDYSHAIWHEGIPSLYAKRNGIGFEEAKALVSKAYDEIGEGRREWYDIRYWFDRFQLGDCGQVLEKYKPRASLYPEVRQVLPALKKAYKLVVSSSSAREFLPYLLYGIDKYFDRVFSSISDYGQLKSQEFYTLVCQETGVKPDEVVHIGDNWQVDFLAAKEAGIQAFHIDRTPEHKDSRSLTSLSNLVPILLGD